MKNLIYVLEEIDVSVLPFYVYVLYKPNGVPFYVGKGQEYRIGEHEYDAKREKPYSKNKHKIRTIQKILKNNKLVQYAIDSWHETEISANNREIELIASIGRKCKKEGPLTNIAGGGEGLSDIPQELRNQIAEKMRLFYKNPENKQGLLRRYENIQQTLRTPEAREEARQNAIKNNSANSLLKWMRDNPELHAEKLKNHSQEMLIWHANNRDRTKEIAAKRNAKFRTDEHRQHMAKKTSEFIKNNPAAVKSRLDAVSETNDKKAIVWQECLQIIGNKALANGKLRNVPKVVTNKTLYKWKQKGITPENMPNGFSSIEILEKFKSDLQS